MTGWGFALSVFELDVVMPSLGDGRCTVLAPGLANHPVRVCRGISS